MSNDGNGNIYLILGLASPSRFETSVLETTLTTPCQNYGVAKAKGEIKPNIRCACLLFLRWLVFHALDL